VSIPSVAITIEDGGLGIVQPGGGNIANEAGWASSGPGGVVQAIGDTVSLVAEYVSGPLVEAAALVLATGATEVLCTRIYDGSMGSTTASGGGANSDLTITGAPMSPYGNPTSGGSSGPIVNIAGSGARGTSTFTYSLDGGKTFSAPQVTGATFAIPGTGLTINFASVSSTAGWSYVVPITTATGSVSSVSQVGATGAAQGAGAIATTGSVPVDSFSVVIVIQAQGTLGVGTYQFSMDGGLTFSSTQLIPSGGGPVVLGGGVQVTFAATGGAGSGTAFQPGDRYSFTTTAPAYTTTDVTNVCNGIVGSNLVWGWIHFIGRPSTPSAAATLASTVDTAMTSWASAGRYARAIIECPPDTAAASIDTALQTAFASFTSDRVMVAAGDANIVSPLSGNEVQRSVAWAATARSAVVPIGEDLGRIASGSCAGVADILRDEAATPNLDAYGFTTMRSVRGKAGYYLTNGRLMASSTSDFQYWQYGRVMDAACNAGLTALLQFLNSSVRVNADGTIYEQDARTIENTVQAAIAAVTTQVGQASAVSVQVSRTQNILSTSTLAVTIGITPLGYAKQIDATIGFINPALALPQAA